jgi:hypothetical protein
MKRAMWFDTLVASWKSWLSRSQRPRLRRLHPGWCFGPEPLECRVLLSNYSAANVAALVADINAANSAGGSNTISLTASKRSPYVLTAADNTTDGATGLPVIAANDNLTIVGNGGSIQRSTAAGTVAFRLFDVAAGASLTLQSLTLQGGLAFGSGVSADGGAIYNKGALTLNGVTVQNNIARGAQGAGNTGNGPGGDAAGGGIYSSGALTLEGGATVKNNQALGGQGNPLILGYVGSGGPGGNGLGGGLCVAGGTAVLTNAILSSNTAQGGQGGSDTSQWTNTYYGTAGGNGLGGGLEVAAGTVTLSSDTLSSNVAQGGSAGDSSNFGPNASGGNGVGGAMQVTTGTVSVASSTLSSNTAQGGQGGTSPDGWAGYGGNGFGGGLEVAGGTVTLNMDTISSNVGEAGLFGSGPVLAPPTGIDVGEGGGLYISAGATVDIDASTLKKVVHNTASTGFPNIFGTYIQM